MPLRTRGEITDSMTSGACSGDYLLSDEPARCSSRDMK